MARRRRCAIYARFSSERQREESIEDQVRVCREWAAREGWEVVAEYADRHISGRTDRRPEFRRMVADAEAGAGWQAVVVYKLDRFARSRADSARYRMRLRAAGVRLLSATETIPDGPEGIIMEGVLDSFAEYYSAALGQNVRRGMHGNALKHKANGVLPMGYAVDAAGGYELDPREAPIVRGVFEIVAAGKGRKEARDWANDQGLRTRRGNELNYDSVRRMVMDERYRGVYHFGDVRDEGGMPRIVDDATWYEANDRLARKPRKYSFPLSGKLWDAQTGKPFRGTAGTSGTGRRYLYYSVPVGAGHEWRVAKELVESTVRDALAECFADPSTAGTLAEWAHAAMVEEAGVDTSSIEAAIADTERRSANILRAIEAGVVPDGAKERIETLREEKSRLTARLSRARASVPDVEEIREFVTTQLYRQAGDRLMEDLVSKVTVDRESGEVDIKIPWSARLSGDSGSETFEKEVLRSRVWWSSREHGRTLYVLPGGLLLRARMAA